MSNKNNAELIAWALDRGMLPARLERDVDMALTMTKLAVALEAANTGDTPNKRNITNWYRK